MFNSTHLVEIQNSSSDGLSYASWSFTTGDGLIPQTLFEWPITEAGTQTNYSMMLEATAVSPSIKLSTPSSSRPFVFAMQDVTSSMLVTMESTGLSPVVVTMSLGGDAPASCSISLSDSYIAAATGSLYVNIVPGLRTPPGTYTARVIASGSATTSSFSSKLDLAYIVPDEPASIESFTPATGSQVFRTTPIGFKVVDKSGFIASVVGVTYSGSKTFEFAHDGKSFGPMFTGSSNTITYSADGAEITYTFLRDGGWIGSPIFTPRVFGISGTLA